MQEIQEKYNSNYDLFMLGISLIALLLVIIYYIPGIPEPAQDIAYTMDVAVSFVFMFDFLRSLVKASNKLAYLKWGWLDFLGSLPSLPIMRLFRIWRIFQVARALRQTPLRDLLQVLTTRRAESSLLIFILVAFVTLGFSSFAVLAFEGTNPAANISSATDALWWAIVTTTTVGYGDRFPITNPGRIVAILLMIIGIGLFSVLTSYLSSAFRAPGDSQQQAEITRVHAELQEIKQLVQELNQKLAEQRDT